MQNPALQDQAIPKRAADSRSTASAIRAALALDKPASQTQSCHPSHDGMRGPSPGVRQALALLVRAPLDLRARLLQPGILAVDMVRSLGFEALLHDARAFEALLQAGLDVNALGGPGPTDGYWPVMALLVQRLWPIHRGQLLPAGSHADMPLAQALRRALQAGARVAHFDASGKLNPNTTMAYDRVIDALKIDWVDLWPDQEADFMAALGVLIEAGAHRVGLSNAHAKAHVPYGMLDEPRDVNGLVWLVLWQQRSLAGEPRARPDGDACARRAHAGAHAARGRVKHAIDAILGAFTPAEHAMLAWQAASVMSTVDAAGLGCMALVAWQLEHGLSPGDDAASDPVRSAIQAARHHGHVQLAARLESMWAAHQVRLAAQVFTSGSQQALGAPDALQGLASGQGVV